jgi:deoxyribose-phosphate aldolase
MRPQTPGELALRIDQTLLKPTAGLAEAARWLEHSRDHGFATVCVAPYVVPLASEHVAGSTTKVCSVAGFPLGYQMTETKAEESARLVSLGCAEVDVVVNVGELIAGEEAFVRDDLAAVVRAVGEASGGRGLLKVILETGHLTEDQIRRGCELAVEAGADFVKTSTGFGPRGASVRDVELMSETVGPDIGVKAAGGIRDLETALCMLEAGASRIGTSSGVEILEQFSAR